MMEENRSLYYYLAMLVSVLSNIKSAVNVSLCVRAHIGPISAIVQLIGVTFCMIVELRPGCSFLLVTISLGVSKCGVKKELRVDHFRRRFLSFDANIWKTVNRSVTCQLELDVWY